MRGKVEEEVSDRKDGAPGQALSRRLEIVQGRY